MSAPYSPLPWRVVPDQRSQGEVLAIESCDGSVVVRSPQSTRYESDEQLMIDQPNLEFIVEACTARDALVAALLEVRLVLSDFAVERAVKATGHVSLRDHIHGALAKAGVK